MRKRSVPVLVVAAAVGIAALTLAPGQSLSWAPGSWNHEARAQDKVDPMTDYKTAWDRAHRDAAKEWEKLAKWCDDKTLEGTAVVVRRRVLKYQPDHPEIRKWFGYVRNPDDTWGVNESIRDKIRELVDIDDPKQTDYHKKVEGVFKKIRESFASIAKKAQKYGAENAGQADEWKKMEESAWYKVLDVDPGNETAHKALGSPKFDGKYCTKYALPFMKVRKERKDGGLARAGRMSYEQGGVQSHDSVIHNVGRVGAHVLAGLGRGEFGPGEGGGEEWLETSIAYDLTRRLTGTCLTVAGAFGTYGNSATPRLAKDLWMELARQQVDLDDDVPMSILYKLTLESQRIRGPEIVKGYAFLQFLFEKDAEKAREFVRRSLAQGSPKAAEDVYGVKSLDELEPEYRTWVLGTW